jgi:Scavenger receptor cysteine-rich domain
MGRIEYFKNKSWNQYCAKEFTVYNGKSFCNFIGGDQYIDAEVGKYSEIEKGKLNGPDYSSPRLNCSGNERDLS